MASGQATKENRAALQRLLRTDLEAAYRQFLRHRVHEWLEEDPEEVVRMMTFWALRDRKDRSLPRLRVGICDVAGRNQNSLLRR